MAGVNKAIIVGNLGQDPDLKHLDGGTAVANFTVATNEKWKDKDGEWKERTEWHKLVAWGKLAEICGQYLHKGIKVYIEGRLQTRSWDKDGEKRYTTEIVVNNMVMLGAKGDPADNASGDDYTFKPAEPVEDPAPGDDDDLPF